MDPRSPGIRSVSGPCQIPSITTAALVLQGHKIAEPHAGAAFAAPRNRQNLRSAGGQGSTSSGPTIAPAVTPATRPLAREWNKVGDNLATISTAPRQTIEKLVLKLVSRAGLEPATLCLK